MSGFPHRSSRPCEWHGAAAVLAKECREHAERIGLAHATLSQTCLAVADETAKVAEMLEQITGLRRRLRLA